MNEPRFPKDSSPDGWIHSGTAAVPPTIPDHELLRPIGRGSYGEVWLARNVMGTYRAVKVVYRRHFYESRPFEREFRGIERFEPISRSHDGFVDILQVGRNETEEYFYSVMELADPVDGSGTIDPASYEPMTAAALVSLRKALPCEQCLEFGLAISSALAFLHQRGLVHRDVKPSNLILVHGQPKLADVGMVTEVGSASIAGGTLGYVAPEGVPSPQADLYSLGKVLYELSTGRDRLEHPALPDFWIPDRNLTQLSELNEVILRACEPDLTRRYPSAAHMHQELVLIQAGESVRRLRVLERMARHARRAGVLLLGLGLLAGYEYHRVSGQREDESRRLADFHASSGANLASHGDYLGSLPWYAAALVTDQGRPGRAERDRMNLEIAIRQAPRPVRMIFLGSTAHDAVFTPDGEQVVLACDNGEVLVHPITSDTPPQPLKGHTGAVRSVALNSDGTLLASAGDDRSVRIWDLARRRQIKVLSLNGPVSTAMFDASGERILVSSRVPKPDLGTTLGLLSLWHWRDASLLATYRAHDERVLSASYGKGHSTIVSTGADGWADLRDANTLRPLGPRLWHPPRGGLTSWVYDSAVSPDGQSLATAAFDGLVRVWETNQWRTTAQMPHTRAVHGVEFSPDGRYLLTACDDQTARIWDLTRQCEAFPPLRHASFVIKATFSPEGRFVATLTTGGIVTLWDLASENRQLPRQEIYSAGGQLKLRIGSDSVQVLPSGETTNTAATASLSTPGRLRDAVPTSDGSRLLLLSDAPPSEPAGSLTAQMFWPKGASSDPPFTLLGFVPESLYHEIAGISLTGDRLALVMNTQVELWDTRIGRLVAPPFRMNHTAHAALSPDGRRLVIFTADQAELIDAVQGTVLARLGPLRDVNSATFSHDSRWLVISCLNTTEEPLAAHIWEASSGRRIPRELGHQDGVSQASFSPDDRFLLTAGEDNVVRQWQVGSWELIHEIRHETGVVSAEFNPQGTRIVTADSDHMIRVWDAQSGQFLHWPITPPLKHYHNLWHARFIDHDRFLLGKRLGLDRWQRRHEEQTPPSAWERHLGPRAARDWERSLWRIEPENLPLTRLHILAELLSAQRIERGETVSLTPADLAERWKQYRAFHPEEDLRSPARALDWHQQQAECALWQEDAPAALFHLERILRLNPGDAESRNLLHRLQTLLAETRPAAPPARP